MTPRLSTKRTSHSVSRGEKARIAKKPGKGTRRTSLLSIDPSRAAPLVDHLRNAGVRRDAMRITTNNRTLAYKLKGETRVRRVPSIRFTTKMDEWKSQAKPSAKKQLVTIERHVMRGGVVLSINHSEAKTASVHKILAADAPPGGIIIGPPDNVLK